MACFTSSVVTGEVLWNPKPCCFFRRNLQDLPRTIIWVNASWTNSRPDKRLERQDWGKSWVRCGTTLKMLRVFANLLLAKGGYMTLGRVQASQPRAWVICGRLTSPVRIGHRCLTFFFFHSYVIASLKIVSMGQSSRPVQSVSNTELYNRWAKANSFLIFVLLSFIV